MNDQTIDDRTKIDAAAADMLDQVGMHCVGYFCPNPPSSKSLDDCPRFGNSELQNSLPWGYLDQLQPVSRLQAAWHDIHPYVENTYTYVDEQRSRRIGEWRATNLANLILYHTEIDCDALVKLFKKDLRRKERHKREAKQYGESFSSDKFHQDFSMPYFDSTRAYQRFLDHSFQDLYFIHCRTDVPRSREGRGYQWNFFVAGDLMHTRELSSFLLEHPCAIKQVASYLTEHKLRPEWLDEVFGRQETLIHFDTRRKPRKSIRKIQW